MFFNIFQLDERLREEQFRAGFLAFRVSYLAGLALAVALWIMRRDDVVTLVVAIPLLTGAWTYFLVLRRAGYGEDLAQKISEDDRTRKRALWFFFTSSLFSAAIMFCYSYFGEQSTLGRALTSALLFACVAAALSWFRFVRAMLHRDAK